MVRSSQQTILWDRLIKTIRQVPLQSTLASQNKLPATLRKQYLLWRQLLQQTQSFLETNPYWKYYMNDAIVKYHIPYQIQLQENKQQNIEKFMFILDYDGNDWKHNRYFDLEIVGASAFGLYFLRSTLSQQLILTIGEYHTTKKNNTLHILRTLASQYQCPIDVLIEMPYVSYSLKNTGKSLISFFHQDNVCVKRGVVPKQTLLDRSQNKQYFQKCVAPFQGKIKFWATDVRQTSWFHWFMYVLHLEKHETLPKHILTETQQLFLTAFDYPLYQKNPQHYDNLVRTKYQKLLTNIIETTSSSFRKRITKNKKLEQLLQQLQSNQEKDHMRFMESLSFFDPRVARNLCGYIVEEYKSHRFFHHVLLSLTDVYTYIRMARLLRENKNRVIVAFMGVHHLDRLDRLIELNPFVFYKQDVSRNEQDFPIIRKYGVQKCPVDGVFLKMKQLPPSRTTRMNIYQGKKYNIMKNFL